MWNRRGRGPCERWRSRRRRRPERPRRKIPAELAWLLKRGDSFVYLTAQPEAADGAVKKLRKLAKRRPRADVLRVGAGEGEFEVDDDFIFEALWFGRCSFVIDSAARTDSFLARAIELLEERNTARARVRQSVHLVWDIDAQIPESQKLELERLANATGFSLFIANRS